MRKISIIILTLFFLTQNYCFAQEQGLDFIYINGSNTDSKENKEIFYNDVYKFHRILKKTIDKDELMVQLFLNNNELKIKEEPNIFYWGDNSNIEIKYLNQILEREKKTTPPLAYIIKKYIHLKLHDAIWISKLHNIIPPLESLNSKIKEAKSKKQKVVLVSYSAGAIIAYQYMLQKLPYLTTTTFLKDADFSQKEIDYMNNHPKKKTCVSAILHSEIGVVTEVGKVIKYKNGQDFIDAYSQLDTITDNYCAPPDTLYGAINIANVINLFCSDYLYDDKYFYSRLNSLLQNYLIENGIVVLSVNFADDILGLQNPQIFTNNITADGVKKGFIAENNDTRVHANFLKAHGQYWEKPQKTVNLIVKAYLDGYRKNIGELPVISKNKR